MNLVRLWVAFATTAALLAGCASFPPDAGMGGVSELVRERTGQPVGWQRSPADSDAAQARIAELSKAPLTPDAAVEIALLGHRGLQADFAELGIAQADLVQAALPKAPTLGFGRLAGGGIVEIDRSVMFGVLDLLTLPAQAGVARQRLEQAQWRAAVQAVGVAAQARRAYFEAVAAGQLAAYAHQVMDAAEAADDLALRMLRVGNLSRLDRLRDQAFHADAAAELARAQQEAASARERLVRALGLGTDGATPMLPDRLPELPAQLDDLHDVEQTALDKRLDVTMARRDAETAAESLGLTQATRFIDSLEVGMQDKRETGAPKERGIEAQVQLPLFDFGGAGLKRAQAKYRQAVDRAAAATVDARSQVREAYAVYRTSYGLARHYRDEVVPLRRQISDESLLRYNGMLVDVFQLLADSREQISSVMACVRAQRDFWIAQSDLQVALTGRPPVSDPSR